MKALRIDTASLHTLLFQDEPESTRRSARKHLWEKTALILAALFFLASLAGCAQEGEDSGTRVVVTNLDDLIPSPGAGSSGLLDYEYWFYPVDGEEPLAPTAREGAEESGTFALAPGSYTARVKAFLAGSGGLTKSYNAIDPENQVAMGDSQPFTVDGGQADVEVAVSPLAGETGAGVFSYLITRPAGTKITIFTLTPLGEGDVLDYSGDPDAEQGDGKTVTRSAINYNIPSGFYTLFLQLEDAAGKIAGDMELLRIYEGRTTEIAWTFSAQDFVEAGSTRGRITIGLTYWDTEPDSDLAVNLSGAFLDKTLTPSGTLTALVPTGYDFLYWAVDGRQLPNALSGLIIDQRTHKLTVTTDMPTGMYRLNLVVTKDGVPYTKWTKFQVRESSEGTFDLDTRSGTGGGWAYASPIVTILDGATVTITGNTTLLRLVVSNSATSTVILSDASIILEGTSSQSPLEVSSGAVATVKLVGQNNTLTASGNAAGIHAPSGTTLKINSGAGDGASSGAFTVTGGQDGAGIGGSKGQAAGSITIAGGTITAYGKGAGAGIGGGAESTSGGDIWIMGGRGSAESESGRGIGPGSGGTDGNFNGEAGAWPAGSRYVWPQT